MQEWIYGNNYAALSGRQVGWIDIDPERCSGLTNFALSGRRIEYPNLDESGRHSLDFFCFVFLYQDKKMKNRFNKLNLKNFSNSKTE
ncbi:MAG TPA: hypothetical protein PK941_13750 [Paludibacter sp.]|nr:hypothetical protein [Paludibacter sp.]